MEVVNVKKEFLRKNGYESFEDWKTKSHHLYIGRNMSVYVKGTYSSKWKNPFSVKKYGRDRVLEYYEAHVRTSSLYEDLEELEGKILGCWCKPEMCHGDVLIKLLKEKKEVMIISHTLVLRI